MLKKRGGVKVSNNFGDEVKSVSKVSDEGLTWEGTEQPGVTVSENYTFGGAIYVPGDGFYIKAGGYVYYAPY